MARSLPRADTFAVYQQWWADAATRLGPNTVRQYRYHVLKALADTGKDPLRMTREQCAKYLGELRPHYAKKIRSALVDFFDFLVRRGHRAANPLEEVKVKTRGGNRLKRGLTLEELTRLLIAAVYASKKRFEGHRLAWMILAQYALGLRPGELCTLTVGRVSLNGSSSCVYITDTKTNNDRVVPMNALAGEALRELMAGRDGQIVEIGTSWYWGKVRRAARLAGISPEKCRPYAMRHTFGTHLAELGVHPRVISELMGHSDLRATMVYTTPSDKQLREAVAKLGDRRLD